MDNRLVADALEADWNERLRRLDTLQQEQERQRAADQELLADDARERIMALTTDFPRVWNDQRTPPIERKRMVALLIEDVTLDQGRRDGGSRALSRWLEPLFHRPTATTNVQSPPDPARGRSSAR